jgi:hypothetical protein
MRYSFITMKHSLDKVTAHLRTGAHLTKDERDQCADVIAATRDWIASTEKRVAHRGRQTARDLREAMGQDVRRGR